MNAGYGIRKIRESKNLTQEYIAGQLNITTKSYGKIESGETKMSLNRLEELCHIFEMTVDDFLRYQDGSVYNNTFNHQQNGAGFVVNQYLPSTEKELYERLIEQQKEVIRLLQEEKNILINMLKNMQQ